MPTGINDKENVNELKTNHISYNIDTYTSIIRLNDNLTKCNYEDQIQYSFYELNEKLTHIHPIYPIMIRIITTLIPKLTCN